MSKKTCAAHAAVVVCLMSVRPNRTAHYFFNRLSITCRRFLPKSGNT